MSSTSERKGFSVSRIGLALLLFAIAMLAPIPASPPSCAENSAQQRGFALPTWQVDGYDGPGVEQALREVKAIGAGWVQFTPTWFQQDRYANEMVRTSGTVSDAGLERAIGLAKAQGLRVFLKPHVDLPVPGQDSRNNIVPADPEVWYAAYTEFITHYAAIAERLGVEQFAMGTEFSSISSDRAAWVQVIEAVRARYSGALTYASGRDWATVPFWDALDLIGIDAYLTLAQTATDDVAALQRSWSALVDDLADLSARHGRRILFTEAGFTSQRGTVTDPSNWRISWIPDQAEQASGYQSLLQTFSQLPWWEGVYWWVWITPPDIEAEPLDFSPRGKAAEAVVRQWWTESRR